jgi:hypothetical protein
MPDRFYACIYIPRKYINSEVRALLKEEGILELSDSVDSDIIQEFHDEQASYGQFEDLEKNLKVLGVPFNRASNGYGEYDPKERCYRPARNDEPEIDFVFDEDNSNHVPVIYASDIWQILKLGEPDEAIVNKLRDYMIRYAPQISHLESWA